ncbi:hypothetical protein FAES_2521 [Sporocytophaga myxococcoides]|uniref:Uncharacterized protein n=2 Tax=Sporocytophaga myxococcoides TaxID=153721 RepID=A0A098LHD9_9BACT|nr:hypothetical protein FAES_2521 [Sporocytophaga myxococcoides]
MKIVVKGYVGRIDAKIYVGQTLPFFKKNKYPFSEQYIKDAIVTISDGNDTVLLSYNTHNYSEENAFYTSLDLLPFDFIPGQKLFLNINLPDGRHVDAVTTVPDEIDVSISKIDSMYVDNMWLNGYRVINNSLNPDYEQRFGVGYMYYSKLLNSSKDTIRDNRGSGTESMKDMLDEMTYDIPFYYKKDLYRDGGEYISYRRYEFFNFFSFTKNLKDYNLGKRFSDRPLIKDPIFSKDSLDFYEEPLFTEPFYYNYYSNINGGLGFFEAYQEKIVYVR